MTITNKTLGRAIAWAAKIHEEQPDKSDEPYILHPMFVMQACLQETYGTREDRFITAIIAICHDAIEDGFKKDYERGFAEFKLYVTDDPRVIEALRLVTKTGENTYEEMVVAIKNNMYAVRVKCHDLDHNMRLSRLKGIGPKDYERMQKYSRAYAYLKGRSEMIYQSA